MTSSKPLISVLVPTRDRPDLLRLCLSSLLPQQADFEVIVSDNFTRSSAALEVEALGADARFRYLRPPNPLTMADNWEFAFQHARGDLIVTLIDKTLLLPSALARLTAAAQTSNAEIFSWWSDFYVPVDEAIGYEQGYYSPQYRATLPTQLDAQQCLSDRLSFATPIAQEGTKYFTAKPCFGAYRRALTARIAEKTGRLFHPSSPDFTTGIMALALTSTVYDMGRPLLLSILSERSNGMRVAQSAAAAKQFVAVDSQALASAPIQGLYASVHNQLAADYVATMSKLSQAYVLAPRLLERLVTAVTQDLSATTWETKTDRFDQWSRLKSFAKKHRIQSVTLDQAPGLAFPSESLISAVGLAAQLLPHSNNQINNHLITRAREEARKSSVSIYEAMYKKFDSPLQACYFGDAHYSDNMAAG